MSTAQMAEEASSRWAQIWRFCLRAPGGSRVECILVRPLLAEDAQWLDRPTTEVLAFVARRLQSDPVVLLAAVREGYPSLLVDAGLPQHRLGGLAPAEAMTLLDASAQQLSPVIRDRLLSEAAGNPLALMELPITAARQEPIAPGSLPLTQRLEQAFAARVSDLPEATRLLLLVAAHSDDERLSEIVDAAGAVAGSTLGPDLLEPAAEAAIVDLDMHSVRFRHPLIRSAVRQSASLLRRRRVHEALAEVLRAEPDRRVWHRAALISGTHEQIANELEEAAGRARRRGALAVAVTALQRAAELSPPGQRARRLLAAAELAFELGQRDLVMPILREVEHLDPDPVERGRATWIHARATRPGPRGSRGPPRGGARRRPHALAASACPAVACLWPVATAPAPDRRIAHAAAGRPRRLRRPGLRSLGRPSPPRANSPSRTGEDPVGSHCRPTSGRMEPTRAFDFYGLAVIGPQ
jgi:hypothetical protein